MAESVKAKDAEMKLQLSQQEIIKLQKELTAATTAAATVKSGVSLDKGVPVQTQLADLAFKLQSANKSIIMLQTERDKAVVEYKECMACKTGEQLPLTNDQIPIQLSNISNVAVKRIHELETELKQSPTSSRHTCAAHLAISQTISCV